MKYLKPSGCSERQDRLAHVPAMSASLAKMQDIAVGCRKDVPFDGSIEVAIRFCIACRASFDNVLTSRWAVT
jgi:hypothetical protein